MHETGSWKLLKEGELVWAVKQHERLEPLVRGYPVYRDNPEDREGDPTSTSVLGRIFYKDIAIILEMTKENSYAKVMTKFGPGWVYRLYLKNYES